MMTLSLPRPVAAYFEAGGQDPVAVADCFTLDATVVDERQTHSGREAIARWKAEASQKFDYVSEPYAIEPDGERFIVTSRVSGNFPGSPVDLRYGFTLADDAIARLEIVP